MLWGSNARETHPIFFHHVLQGIRNGARLYAVDPRRTSSAAWADVWLGLDVGTDIALSNTLAREILHAGLVDREFVRRGTSGFEEYARSVEPWTLERGELVTGVPREAIREFAHALGTTDRVQICWTLGITEHHNAVDNVLALINLGLLTGHVGRYGCGLNPLRGQNNVQGGGDMGAIPNKLAGFQDLADEAARGRFEQRWNCTIAAERGYFLTEMFEAMEHGSFHAAYVIGENPAASEADALRARRLLEGLDFLLVQDIYRTQTAELADVVLPAAAAWCESEGTVTNSERRVQRVRQALPPPAGARDDMWIVQELARRLGHAWSFGETPRELAENAWNELRALSPMHAGMSYARLEAAGGLRWPCLDESDPGATFLHGRLWERDPDKRGRPAPFSVLQHEPPVDALDADFPIRLTTGRRLSDYNTGVQSGGFSSPLRVGECIELSPEDARELGLREGDPARVSSRRGAVEAPVRIDPGLRPGLAFMTFHFPDEVDVNRLTIDAWDPKSGTAEFKATAVRVEKLVRADVVGTAEARA